MAYDTVPLGGFGNPARPVGLIHSAFRPSDDACVFPFLVPSNLFAVVSLRQLAEITDAVTKNAAFAAECRALADEVAAALTAHALVPHPRQGVVWAYEVDGFGNALFMDDANVPSLLSLPYLGCAEVLACLRTLRATHAGTGFMHEAFHEDDPARFTRKRFAWANTLFGELVLRVRAERPHLLRERM